MVPEDRAPLKDVLLKQVIMWCIRCSAFTTPFYTPSSLQPAKSPSSVAPSPSVCTPSVDSRTSWFASAKPLEHIPKRRPLISLSETQHPSGAPRFVGWSNATNALATMVHSRSNSRWYDLRRRSLNTPPRLAATHRPHNRRRWDARRRSSSDASKQRRLISHHSCPKQPSTMKRSI